MDRCIHRCDRPSARSRPRVEPASQQGKMLTVHLEHLFGAKSRSVEKGPRYRRVPPFMSHVSHAQAAASLGKLWDHDRCVPPLFGPLGPTLGVALLRLSSRSFASVFPKALPMKVSARNALADCYRRSRTLVSYSCTVSDTRMKVEDCEYAGSLPTATRRRA